MDEFEDIDSGFTILPGVDLTLWVRLLAVILLVLAAGALTLALR